MLALMMGERFVDSIVEEGCFTGFSSFSHIMLLFCYFFGFGVYSRIILASTVLAPFE